MESNQWYNNEALKGIDVKKMMLLQELLGNTKGRSTNEMLPLLMAASKKANSKGLKFSKEEIKIIVSVLEKDMSPGEREKATKLLSIMGL
jgi:hypothetical protein